MTVSGSGFNDFETVKGRKLTPKDVYTATLAAATTGGTLSTDKPKAVKNENMTLTLTPDAGYLLTAVTWNDGTNNHNISPASPTTAAYSQTITMPAHDVTVSATFAPIVASITSGGTTTYFASIADAIEAGDGETIDVLRQIDESATNYEHSSNYRDVTIDLHGYDVKFGELHKKGPLTIKSTETGGKFTAAIIDNADEVSIDGTTLVCTSSLVSITNVTFTNSTATIKDLNNGNNSDHLTLTNSTVTTTNSLQWFSDFITLSGGSRLILNGGSFFVGDGSHTLSLNIDNTSLMRFIECTITGYGSIEAPLSAYLSAADATNLHVDGSTKNNLDLRGKWTLDLANSIPTYTSGESTYPKAVVQFYDGGTTAPTASTFDPSLYHPTGEAGANEITTINNSDGADHYIIMHVAPSPNGGYWTDARLLYVMEGASAGARSRGPGISLNLPELLKRDLNDPSDPSQGYRYDGSGWYYYKLPASHCVANGYTKSTLFVEATRWFDLNDEDDSDGDKVVQDGKKITVPNHEGWTAEILLDEVTFEFDGTVKTPQITQIAFNNGSGTLFTLTDNDFINKMLKVYGTKHIGLFPRKGEYMIECVGTGWFTGTTPTATETTPSPVGYLVTVPLPVDDTSAERGTETNPWLVSTIAQMTLFGQCVDVGAYDFDGKYVRLAADLEYDATATNNYTPIGSGTPFAGTFFGTTVSGTPHVISGIRYAGTPALDKVGLFSQLGKNGGTGAVKDLQLKDCKFSGTNTNLSGFSGGVLAADVVGTQISNVTVSKCEITGSVNVSGVTSVGGLAGNVSQASNVSGCLVSKTTVDNSVTNDLGTEDAFCQTGGLSGYAHDSEINGCTVADCQIHSNHSGENCPGNETGGIVGSAPNGVKLLTNRVKGNTQFFDNIASNNYSHIGAIYGNNYGTGGETDEVLGDVGFAIFMNNYYDISVDISYMNGSMSEAKYIVGYMPRGTRVFEYNKNSPYNLISVEFGDVTYGTVDYENNDPARPLKGTNDAAKMYVKPATISLIAATGRSLVFTKTTTPKLATAANPADCYAIDVDPIDGSPLKYYYAPGQFIPFTVNYQQRTVDVRTFYDEVTITAKDGSDAHADVTLSPNGLPTPSGSTTPSGITPYTQDFFFAMPADGVDVTADISESQWFTINTVNYNADDPSQPHAYNWMTFYHEWTDGTGTAAKPANYKVTNYDDPTASVEVLTVTSVDSEAGTYTAEAINGSYSGVPTIFHYADNSGGTLPQKLKFMPDSDIEQNKTHDSRHFKGTATALELSADAKCYVLNNAGDFILAYVTPADNTIAAHRCYMDLSGDKNNQARLVFVGGETGIGRVAIDGSTDGFDGPWYSLDGRRLNGQPTRKGIYIYKGKKTVIK